MEILISFKVNKSRYKQYANRNDRHYHPVVYLPLIMSMNSLFRTILSFFQCWPGSFLVQCRKNLAMLAPHLQQSDIIKKLTGSKQKLRKSDVIQTTLHWVFSGVSRTTLHRVFSCAMLSQEYYDIIEQGFFMCNVVLSFFDNIAQGFYLCSVVPRVLRQHWL